MNAKDAIRAAGDLSSMVLKTYLSDLSDAELLLRPNSECNHIAYQLGHLISSEVQLLQMIVPGTETPLPSGFVEAHAKENAKSDDASLFQSKATYLELVDKVRETSLAALESMDDARLDEPAPEAFAQFAPTMGHVFMLLATHQMMHAGQIVVVRRQLGKPVLI